jgi:hypothetical protein
MEKQNLIQFKNLFSFFNKHPVAISQKYFKDAEEWANSFDVTWKEYRGLNRPRSHILQSLMNVIDIGKKNSFKYIEGRNLLIDIVRVTLYLIQPYKPVGFLTSNKKPMSEYKQMNRLQNSKREFPLNSPCENISKIMNLISESRLTKVETEFLDLRGYNAKLNGAYELIHEAISDFSDQQERVKRIQNEGKEALLFLHKSGSLVLSALVKMLLADLKLSGLGSDKDSIVNSLHKIEKTKNIKEYGHAAMNINEIFPDDLD